MEQELRGDSAPIQKESRMNVRRQVKDLLSRPEVSAFLMLLIMLALFSASNPYFLTLNNFMIILQPIPEITLIAIGVTILMVSGEFDLSVGSVFAFSPMIMVLLLAAGIPVWLAIVVALIGAAAVGLCNSFITLKIGLPSFITTLGMLFMIRSLTIVMSGGFPPPFPRDMDTSWLVGRIDLLRASIFYLVAFAIVLAMWLRRTDFGSWIYATGGNTQAAHDMGINTALVKTTAFVLCSVLAGFAGIIQCFRIKAIIPTMGTGFELHAIAAAVIGGAALTGGVGTVMGAIIGALLIAFIENIIIINRIDANWFKFAVGAMIVFSVALNTYTRRAADKMKV
ncbi:putative ABC-type branched-chain amino acid transport system, permease component [Vibrio nigripulchritudo SFn27]|uniref:ABC transporter permease n=1 Tax=Vibrio nigripulchritudo TaxID=28173 RepID=UPI0003B21277|nr:ABC transporter permease [Vibrio nigripulchritudo]CCN81273.1 putative ABC-type branched-chain amino acid transport system, permease component [Vibrio nigripulchritudo BLFn1]CCN86596.1 putative ABC-type branched-chain amino acid transport system, permease component [Vibrio nigripulchritudo SFn27]CCN97157.1 putative ABC-type branched-chain amino acid transport system, permease component [Vibrio nigripulchritudo ENn2]CCO43010.1 putative ABC-type branched-chain amino acid transport system, perme